MQLNDLLDLLSSYGLICAEWQCGDPMSYSGYDYSTIEFEGTCWFAENLRTLVYRNGEDIPSNLTDSQWNYADYGATTVYGEDGGCNNYSPDIDSCDPEVALEEYGRLYNWYAVNDDRGLCPEGWHVPSEGSGTTWFLSLEDLLLQGKCSSLPMDGVMKDRAQMKVGSTMPGGKRQDGSGYFSAQETMGLGGRPRLTQVWRVTLN